VFDCPINKETRTKHKVNSWEGWPPLLRNEEWWEDVRLPSDEAEERE